MAKKKVAELLVDVLAEAEDHRASLPVPAPNRLPGKCVLLLHSNDLQVWFASRTFVCVQRVVGASH